MSLKMASFSEYIKRLCSMSFGEVADDSSELFEAQNTTRLDARVEYEVKKRIVHVSR